MSKNIFKIASLLGVAVATTVILTNSAKIVRKQKEEENVIDIEVNVSEE